MRITTGLSLVLLVLAFGGYAIAQDSVKKIGEFISAEMSRQKIPGVAVAVVKDGKLMLVKGYGFASIEHQIPVKPETIFQSGSVGKQFTAMAVMMLVEEGKISLDEKIGKYLGGVPETWANITVRHLLSHTGGMTDYPQDFDFRRDYTEDEVLKRAKEIPVAFKPGEKWQYSNLGYVTLGIVISKVTGKFYGEFLQERIFKPLGMTTARIINEADIIPNRASGYRLVQGQVKNQDWVSPTMNTTADGSLYLTALDMIKWDEALANGKLLKKTSFDEMWSPIKLNDGKTHPYGFGWAIRLVNGRRVIEHGGAWQGFKAHIARFPDNKLTVIVFANLIQTNQGRLANGVAAIIDPELKPKPIADPDPAFTARTKELLIAVLDGKADLARFTPDVQKVITDQQDRLAAFVKTMGTIQSFQLMERSQDADGLHYRYQIEYTGMNLFLAMVVNKEGKISSFAAARVEFLLFKVPPALAGCCANFDMGYASYLEDINRRLEDGLAAARSRRISQTHNDALSDKKLLRDLEALIENAGRELSRLKNLQDIASDSGLDQAQEVISLRVENERLKRTIESFEGDSIGLADRYLQLVDEKNDLEELINRDLVDEFYELDNKYGLLRERESALLRQEQRLLERLKRQKEEHDDYVDRQAKLIAELETELKKEKNLREILEIEVTKHRPPKSSEIQVAGSIESSDTVTGGSELSGKIRELEKKWK